MPSVSDRASLSFFLCAFHTPHACFAPCFRMFLQENRQDPPIPIPQPIPSDTQFVSFWFPGRPSSVELNKFNWPRPAVVNTCENHAFLLNELLDTRLGSCKRLWPQLKVYGLLSLLWPIENAILLFHPQVSCFHRCIGTYLHQRVHCLETDAS